MQWVRFTIFHVIGLAVIALFVLVGVRGCLAWFGWAGAIGGGVVGFVVGLVVCAILDTWLHRSSMRDLEAKSNAQLWSFVRTGEWKFYHTMALLVLAARGEDVTSEFPRVVEMLHSDDRFVRIFGWDAIRIVFTEEMKYAEGYEPRESTDQCREKANPLKARIEEVRGGRSGD